MDWEKVATTVGALIAAATGIITVVQTYLKHRRDLREQQRNLDKRWSLEVWPHPVKYLSFDAVLRYRIDRQDHFRLLSLVLVSPRRGVLAPSEDQKDLFGSTVWGERSFEFPTPPALSGIGERSASAAFEHRFMVRLPSSAEAYRWPIKISVLVVMEEISAEARLSQTVVNSKVTAWTASKPVKAT